MAGSAALSERAEAVTTARIAVLLRDLARGGMAGAIAGVLIAGIGGRVVMRLAALAVPSSTGQFTENGNRIGDITLGGSLGIVIIVGLLFGAIGAILWVVTSPWIPGRGLRRGVLTMPVAVGLGALILIRGDNRDFRILGHSALVVAILVGLVASLGLVISLIDDWLDRRLPAAGTESGRVAGGYVLLVTAGLVMTPLVVAGYFSGDFTSTPLGLAMVATGLATAAWWVLRFRGVARPPTGLVILGRTALIAAVVLGTALLLPEVSAALDLPG